jgi:hypothetical protein
VLRTLLYLSYLIRFHSIDPKKAKKGTLQEWNCHVSATFLIDCCCKTSRHSQADLREIPGNFLGKTRKRSRRAPVRFIYISLSLSLLLLTFHRYWRTKLHLNRLINYICIIHLHANVFVVTNPGELAADLRIRPEE